MGSYCRLAAEFYDIDKPEAPEDAFTFYASYANQAGGRILEPMCGSGRFLLPLLAQGFAIEGSDPSPFMLAACRERALAAGVQPVLYPYALHEDERRPGYALVMIPAGSIGLITDSSQLMQGLRNLHAALLPGGKLVLEIDRPSWDRSCSWPWSARWLQRPDGKLLVLNWVGQYAASERVSYSLHRYELVSEGKIIETELEEFNVRYYEGDEFHAILAAAGFAQIKRCKPFEQCDPDGDDEGVVFECTKQ